jgi:hypothetical protein
VKQEYGVEVKLDYVGDLVIKTFIRAGRWWLTPVILATQEAVIRRIMV